MMIKKYLSEEEIDELIVSRYLINTDIKESRKLRKLKPILLCLKEGLINKEIGAEIKMNARTVEGHITRLCELMGARNRVQLVINAIKMKIISIDEKPDFLGSKK